MAEQHGSYYVPEHSIWPIIGSIGLFFFAIGSLNFSSLWGTIVFFVGILILLFMISGWLRDVVQESHKGFYDDQMNRTFRWGMFWFIFCETFFFGTPLGALLYTRFATLPWLSGHGTGGSLLTHYVLWPHFQGSWPLVKDPNPYAFPVLHLIPGIWQTPAVNTIVLLCSMVFAVMAARFMKRNQRTAALLSLFFTIALGVLFLTSQIHFMLMVMDKYGVTINSGIYGSLLFMLYGFHTIHVVVGLLVLLVTFLLTIRKHFNPSRTFGFSAAVWFWEFITVAWLAIFICVYV